MKILGFLILFASILASQTANPLTDAVTGRYRGIKQNLIESAEVMPEASYAFRLTPPQRTYAEWIGHVVIGNYNFCSVIKGEKAPATEHIHAMTGKGALSKTLLESFQYCDAALQGMTDQKALAAVTVGDKKVFPVQGMVNLVSSHNEHYGNIVGYLRSKGIVPPSTARAARKK